jgi:tRNA A-37 threonylcarbamoyl transferase component Bud32
MPARRSTLDSGDRTSRPARERGVDDPLAGRLLDGRYLLLERLGAGGMGVVYKAQHRYTGELVAVKLLPSDPRGPAAERQIRDRFMKEPRLQLLARHPNIPRVIDAGTAGAQSYVVTEYVDGEDLQLRLAERGALPLEETLAILHAAAAALDAAHERGIVHRDVKPANVLIRADGHVLLTDFGVAKEVAGADRTAMFVGTLDYASPEQIQLDGPVDTRADVYSLGCVMFHCLSGHPPFPSRSLYELMNAHVGEPPPAVSAGRPGVPALDAVVRRALAKKREQRHAHCGEFVADAAAACGIELSSAAVPPPRRRAGASGSVADADAPTSRYATGTPTLVLPDRMRRGLPEQPTEPAGRPAATSRSGLRWSVRLAIGLVAVIGALVGAESIGDGTVAGNGSATGTTAGARGDARDATAGFTGYAAQLARHFPEHISRARCSVEPGGDPEALVQIRCPADRGRIDTYYELWPDEAAMNRLLDARSSGLNVYFAGTWIDDRGTPRGRISRFFTGIFNPRNVILWSYRAVDATIWAESTLDEDALYSWWRKSAPSAA